MVTKSESKRVRKAGRGIHKFMLDNGAARYSCSEKDYSQVIIYDNLLDTKNVNKLRVYYGAESKKNKVLEYDLLTHKVLHYKKGCGKTSFVISLATGGYTISRMINASSLSYACQGSISLR